MQHGDTRLRAPYMDTLRASPYAPQYWHLDRVVGGGLSVVTCYVATLPRVSLRVPYMKRVGGSLRVLLFFCYSSQTYSPSRVTLWVPLWGDLESFPQVLPGSGMQDEGLGYY